MNDSLVGQRFTRLLVIAETPKNGRHGRRYDCECDCGKHLNVDAYKLKSGRTRSCGCWRRELSTTHGCAGDSRPTRTYRSWCGMKTRCINPNNTHYDKYGGRGISVCERWQFFENFLDDMGESPPGMTIDRIDNNGHYEPGNCRWATRAEQTNNRRNNINIEFLGRMQTLAQWSKEVGINFYTIRGRLLNGWTVEMALSTPPGALKGRSDVVQVAVSGARSGVV